MTQKDTSYSVNILPAEEVISNYEKFKKFSYACGKDAAALDCFYSELGERLMYCPASSKVDFHNAFIGGLVEHSLRVLRIALAINKIQFKLPEKEVIFAALMHDIGKLGDPQHERYLPQRDTYWFKRGNVYEVNKDLPFATTSHGGLFLMQYYKIDLTFGEFMGILLNDGQYIDDNRAYGMKECSLAVLIHTADRLACEEEKNKPV